MVHPGGFEPPTARFVAEYSIQLSYGCIGIYCFTAGSTSSLLMSLRNMVHPGGFEPPTARFVAEYSIQLSYGCIGDTALLLIQRHANCNHAEEDGASGRMIRLRLTLTGRCTAALSSLDFAINIAYQVTPSLLMSLRNMVHPGGFEPPTARFVAEYSIQLSYGCIGIYCFTADISIAAKAILSKRWCIREDSNLRPLGS